MAEGFGVNMFPEGVTVFSAGTDPQGINPRAIIAMNEVEIDISAQQSQHVNDLPIKQIDTVITLCGDANENCPVFPSNVERIHWDLNDPAAATGSDDEIMSTFRAIRDKIKSNISELIAERL